MRIGIITFQRALNFGAILQAYALQKVIRDLNIKCEVIDYRCVSIELNHKPITLNKVIHLRSFAKLLMQNKIEFMSKKKFTQFLLGNVALSSETDKNNIHLFCDKYDCVIAGSDQIWNYSCTGFDKNFFLDFVNESTIKCSYAASFGFNEMPKQYLTDYRTLLETFDFISVREMEGARIVKQLLQKDVPVVLDPTLLIKCEDWLKKNVTNIESDKYILVYLIVESELLFEIAKTISKSTGLKIVYINTKLFSHKGMKNIRYVGPDEWIDLVYNASYIVTNSFHGVAFSINFNKEFYTQLLPPPAKVNSRITDILKLFKLEDRLVYKNTLDNKTINYSIVNKILENEREKSFGYIKDIIKFVNERKSR